MRWKAFKVWCQTNPHCPCDENFPCSFGKCPALRTECISVGKQGIQICVACHKDVDDPDDFVFCERGKIVNPPPVNSTKTITKKLGFKEWYEKYYFILNTGFGKIKSKDTYSVYLEKLYKLYREG